MSRGLKVLKFGGSSLGDAERISRAAVIIKEACTEHRPLVVVSAMEGVTNKLVELADGVCEEPLVCLANLQNRHSKTARSLLGAQVALRYERYVIWQVSQVRSLFRRGVCLDGAARDRVLALGERLSAPLVSAALKANGLGALATDAGDLIRTDDRFGNAVVDYETTRLFVNRWISEVSDKAVPVVTGFIGSDPSGRTTTLGRGGSDLTAAIIASIINAKVLERWTDVNGVYTKDPASHSDAIHLKRVELEEAAMWNRAGRIGMHREALEPLLTAGIPVHVRCTLAPDGEGTWLVPATARRRIKRILLGRGVA